MITNKINRASPFLNYRFAPRENDANANYYYNTDIQKKVLV